MSDQHQTNLKRYVNDALALERDIINAIKGQLDDDRVDSQLELKTILREIVALSENRLERLHKLSEDEGGSFGTTVKEGITSVAGTLAGFYGKIREHPLSRMVRDDIIAMDVSSVSYGMLLTLGLSIGHHECAEIAKEGLHAAPPFVVRLTDLLPEIVAGELADDAPLANPAAAQVAYAEIRDSWKYQPERSLV